MQCGDADIVKALLTDVPDIEGILHPPHPSHLTSTHLNSHSFKMPPVDALDDDHCAPLHKAVSWDHPAIIKLLADVSNTLTYSLILLI